MSAAGDTRVQTWIHVPCLDSTSDEARRLLMRGGLALPLLVRADRQSAGRGRGSNTWWSDEGSLTFTLGLDPADHRLASEHFPRVALATAVAICEAIAALFPTVAPGIRWPNDIEAAGRKLGGILPEVIATPQGTRLALGIGLNVSTRLERAPAAVRAMAVSLQELSGRRAELSEVLEAILAGLGPALDRLSWNDPDQAARWAELDLLYNRPVRVALGSEILIGQARGIEPRGGLLIEEPGRPSRVLFAGQVLREP